MKLKTLDGLDFLTYTNGIGCKEHKVYRLTFGSYLAMNSPSLNRTIRMIVVISSFKLLISKL
jgi:hypothetical protein